MLNFLIKKIKKIRFLQIRGQLYSQLFQKLLSCWSLSMLQLVKMRSLLIRLDPESNKTPLEENSVEIGAKEVVMSRHRERLELGFHKLKNDKNCLNLLEYKRRAWAVSSQSFQNSIHRHFDLLQSIHQLCGPWNLRLALNRRWLLTSFRALLAVESHSWIWQWVACTLLLKSVCSDRHTSRFSLFCFHAGRTGNLVPCSRRSQTRNVPH